MPLINDNVTYTCNNSDPPCSFTRFRYIKVADIILDNFDTRCDRYSIRLSGPDKSFFVIDDLKLYIKSEVLDFDMIQKTYSVSVILINSNTSETVVTRNHSVCVFPCDCDGITTTTSSTTTTVTSSTTTTTTTITPGTQWVQRGIDIDGENPYDNSGFSVSLSNDGNVLAIGAPQNKNENNSGHVRVYAWNGSEWIQRGIDIDGENAFENNGFSVSLSGDGNVLAIGAPNYSLESRTLNSIDRLITGSAKVYDWSGSSWIQRGFTIVKLGYSTLGHAVSLNNDGNLLAIGCQSATNDFSGLVYFWNGSSWIQRGNNIYGPSSADGSGYSVSLSNDGNILSIGAPYHNGNGIRSGNTRIYSWNGSSWIPQVDIDGEGAYNLSGYSVSLSGNGNALAIGAPYNNKTGLAIASGHVRVYVLNGSSWVKQGDDIDGEYGGDNSGCSVSLSDDGNILAIGAIHNNSSGHVRVYYWNGSNWIKRGDDLYGEAIDDYSGWSVSLSSNGSVLAVGAVHNSGNGRHSGHVRVYVWS